MPMTMQQRQEVEERRQQLASLVNSMDIDEKLSKIASGEVTDPYEHHVLIKSLPILGNDDDNFLPAMIRMYYDVNDDGGKNRHRAEEFAYACYEVMTALFVLDYRPSPAGPKFENRPVERACEAIRNSILIDSGYGIEMRRYIEEYKETENAAGYGIYDEVVDMLTRHPGLLTCGPTGRIAGINSHELASCLKLGGKVEKSVGLGMASDEADEILNNASWEQLVDAVRSVHQLEHVEQILNGGVRYAVFDRFTKEGTLGEQKYPLLGDEDAIEIAMRDDVAVIACEHSEFRGASWELCMWCDAFGLVGDDIREYLVVFFDGTPEGRRKVEEIAARMPKRFLTTATLCEFEPILRFARIREKIGFLDDYAEYPRAFHHVPTSKVVGRRSCHFDWLDNGLDMGVAIGNAIKAADTWELYDIARLALENPNAFKWDGDMAKRMAETYEWQNDIIEELGCGMLEKGHYPPTAFVSSLGKRVSDRLCIEQGTESAALDERELQSPWRFMVASLVWDTFGEVLPHVPTESQEKMTAWAAENFPQDPHERLLAMARLLRELGLVEYIQAWQDGVPVEDIFA